MKKTFFLTIFISLAVVVSIGLIGYSTISQYLGSEDRLVSGFREDLITRNFKAMYQESSDFMKANVSQDEFVRRMTIVAETLKEYDPEFNFLRKIDDENLIKEVRENSDSEVRQITGGNSTTEEAAGFYFAMLETGEMDKKATVYVSWVQNGIRPRLFDLTIGDSRVSLANRINTLAGKPFRAGE